MKKSLLALSLCALIILQACQNDDNNSGSNQEQKVILNTDAQSLANRMNFDDSGVINLVADGNLAARDGSSSSDFPMSLLATVNPPSYNGVTLTASHVDVKDNYVYVSYNTQGETYLGGIDVIDVSQPNNPQLVVQAILPNTDISTVVYNNGQLYIAGATNVDSNGALTSPAFVAKMPLQNGMLTNNYSSVSLVGNVATGLAVSSDSKYYGVSGNNGVVAKIDKTTNTIETTIAIADLRAMGRIDNKIVVLSGSDGVKVFNADNLALQSSFSTSSDVLDAKRTIDFQGNNLLVSEGYQGLKVYNLTSGSLLQTLSLPTGLPDVDQNDVVTNAVSVNGDFVYVANGAAGVYVYKKVSGNLSLLGSIQLGGSSNYVKSAGDYIFVATGTGGLKIIKKVTVSSIDCTAFATYNGGQWLNVNSGETLSYQGSAALQGINVNQNLTFCGSLSVAQQLNVNSNGIFTLKGSLAQGQNNTTTMHVNGTFRVEGSVVIYGNLTLNSGAKLEFLGSNSSITIYGNVVKNSNVTITGTYTDVLNKLN